jgi:GMP synthase (glutamine-hydrolysing)
MFTAMLREYAPEVALDIYDVQKGDYPPDLDTCDGYVCNGSAASVYDDETWIRHLEAFVRRLYREKRKLVGICFGQQVMAQALGGRVTQSDQGWGVGVKAANVVRRRPWMNPAADSFRLLVSHQDQIVELPPGGEVLAENAHCPISMLQAGESFLGVQGHPDFTKEYARALMYMRQESIGKECLEKADESLVENLDAGLIVSWIVHFIES